MTLYVSLSRKTAYGEMAARLPSGLGPAAPQLRGPTLFIMQPLLERLISHPQERECSRRREILGRFAVTFVIKEINIQRHHTPSHTSANELSHPPAQVGETCFVRSHEVREVICPCPPGLTGSGAARGP